MRVVCRAEGGLVSLTMDGEAVGTPTHTTATTSFLARPEHNTAVLGCSSHHQVSAEQGLSVLCKYPYMCIQYNIHCSSWA